jgi:hypothetical protein
MNKRTITLVRYGLLFFAVFFSLVALAQYLFVRSQLDRTISVELRRSANAIRREIAYKNKWDLAGFRRWLVDAPQNYVVMASNGLLIDVEGLVPGLLPRVSLPPGVAVGKSSPFESSVGERWHLLVRALEGGKVIVGEPDSENDSDVDKRLAMNAERFGTTIEQAAQLRERFIDGPVDYAVVNDAGEVLSAAGGIPLKMAARTLTDTFSTGSQIRLAGKPYYVVTMAVSEGIDPIATVVVFKNISLERRIVRKARTFNAAAAGMSWLITGIVFGIYGYSQRGIRISCEEAYSRDECQTIEFKSSLRWDHESQERTKIMEGAVVKTVAAFLNTDGGVLLIGVNDKKQVLGLEADYKTLTTKPNKDGFELALQQVLSKALGADSYVRDVRVGFCNMDGKEICVVSVDRSQKPIIIEESTPAGTQPTLYVRVGNATKPLNLREALDYSKERWAI